MQGFIFSLFTLVFTSVLRDLLYFLDQLRNPLIVRNEFERVINSRSNKEVDGATGWRRKGIEVLVSYLGGYLVSHSGALGVRVLA
ncbi:hypothetical protein Tco_0213540 [Tanacetum coccineum]